MIPGWFLVSFLIPFVFALLSGIQHMLYMTFLVSYWFFRAIKFVIGIYIGVKRMEESIETVGFRK